jgi:hypothetical protein
VAEANRDRSARHAFVLVDWRGRIDADLVDSEGPEADAHRGELRDFLIDSRGENESFGIELDYRLRDSPVIIPDGSVEPPWDPLVITPSARPGHRLPNVRTDFGVAVHDLLGPDFTLLVLDPTNDDEGERLFGVARAMGMPMHVVSIDDPHLRTAYAAPLVLVRPDGYVAWRGDAALPVLESVLESVLDTVRGADRRV